MTISNYIPFAFSHISKTRLWISLLKTLHQFFTKTIIFSVSYQNGDGAIEPYAAEHNVGNDENDYDYESPEPVIDPDTIPEKFEISPTKFHMTKTKVKNLAPRSLSKLQQRYEQETKQLKLSLPEAFPPGQGTELIILNQMVKMIIMKWMKWWRCTKLVIH